MPRANINILGFNELKWAGMDEFNSDDHYIYYCGQESLRRNGVAIIVNKSPKCSTWMQSQKWQNDLCSFPRQTIQYTVIQVYASSSNAEEAEVEQFYEDLQDLLELTPKKDVFFIIGDWNAKVGSQEISGVKRQVWPWKWSWAKANRVLSREHACHSKHALPKTEMTTLDKDITRRSILESVWLYSFQLKMEKLSTVSKNKTWSWLWLRSWAP